MKPELAPLLAILFAAGRAVAPDELARGLGQSPEEVEKRILELERHLADGSLGVRLERVAGGVRLVVHPKHAEAVRRALKPRPPRLSRAALEVLAIVAYHQPISTAEINAARGKDSAAVIEGLLERGLIEAVGKHPRRYRTTKRFLEIFGLESLEDLPPPPAGELPAMRD